MENLVIDQATIEEREWTAVILSNSQPWIKLGITFEQCLKTCNDPEYLLFIAHLNEKRCGAIVLHNRGVAGSPYLKSIIVPSEFRGKGIGRELMKFIENFFRKNAKHIFLCVSSFNKAAQSFYVRIGYQVVGELKDYIIEGESEILMHKRLA